MVRCTGPIRLGEGEGVAWLELILSDWSNLQGHCKESNSWMSAGGLFSEEHYPWSAHTEEMLMITLSTNSWKIFFSPQVAGSWCSEAVKIGLGTQRGEGMYPYIFKVYLRCITDKTNVFACKTTQRANLLLWSNYKQHQFKKICFSSSSSSIAYLAQWHKPFQASTAFYFPWGWKQVMWCYWLRHTWMLFLYIFFLSNKKPGSRKEVWLQAIHTDNGSGET